MSTDIQGQASLLDPATFDELKETLDAEGPAAAIERLCTVLRERRDYTGLFYAMLMKKRLELGVSPVPTGPAQELPEGVHEPYENAIREAGRLVGRLYLQEGNIPQAWAYFRMLGEPEPVREALERAKLGENDDCQPLVDIAFYQAVHPRRGFDLLLGRFGICNAITTLSSQQLPFSSQDRDYCIQRLVRALYDELAERLKADIARREGAAPDTKSVKELMAGRDWMFEDEFYHIDVSHLSSVVQMSISLPRCPELELARELCDYGKRLSSRFQYPADPPFENQYADYAVYLAVIAGDRVDEGVAHFRTKAEKADPENEGTYPAEVLVNLLLRLDRPGEALGAARRFLTKADRPLTCPSVAELCQRAGDYRALAEVSREREDPVHFLAGLIAAQR
jgi:hypothetical protein